MNSSEPYTPSDVPHHKVNVTQRSYYIYSSSVLLLLWAGIYFYLNREYDVSLNATHITLCVRAPGTQGVVEFSIAAVVLSILGSAVFVNSVLWATLKILYRN